MMSALIIAKCLRCATLFFGLGPIFGQICGITAGHFKFHEVIKSGGAIADAMGAGARVSFQWSDFGDWLYPIGLIAAFIHAFAFEPIQRGTWWLLLVSTAPLYLTFPQQTLLGVISGLLLIGGRRKLVGRGGTSVKKAVLGIHTR